MILDPQFYCASLTSSSCMFLYVALGIPIKLKEQGVYFRIRMRINSVVVGRYCITH